MVPWAKFRRRKAAVKLHTLLALRGNIPVLIHITPGNMHEVKILGERGIEAGSIYIMDRASPDCARLYRAHQSHACFVMRAKRKFAFIVLAPPFLILRPTERIPNHVLKLF